ncbi:hypothetical protein JCM30566_14140 [Marinitoga arctica]
MGIKEFFNRVTLYLFLIIFIIGNIFFYLSYRKEINNRINVIKNNIEIISSNIRNFIDNEKLILNNISNNITFVETQDFLKSDILKKIYLLNGENLKYVYFADINGNISTYPEINIPSKFTPKEKEWYREALESNNVVISSSFADVEKTELVITLSKALKNDKNLLGVIGFDLNNEKIIKILDSTILNNLYQYSIIKNGKVLFNKEIHKKSESTYQINISNLKFNKTFDLIKDKNYIYTYHKIENDLYLLYVYDLGFLKAELIMKSYIYFFIVLFFLVVLEYMYGKILVKNIVIPISEISDSMKSFSLDLKKKRVPNFSKKYKIKEIHEISKNYEKFIGSSIATMLNFNLLTDRIKDMYNKLEKVNNMFFEIINLISLLDKNNLSIEKYYESILKYAINHIEEAKYGSISIIKNGKWEYIASVGHNISILKNIRMNVEIDESSINKVNLLKFDQILDKDKKYMNKDDFEKLKLATKPYKYALTYISNIDKSFLIISIDSPDEKGFSKSSIEIFEAYVELAKIFLYKKYEITRTENIYFRFAEKLASIAEGHDDITGKHIYRVGEISTFLAKKMNFDERFIEKIRKFAPLHDIGKVYVPYDILNKEGKLTKEEFEIMKTHTIYARNLFEDDKYFDMALNIALYHHENCDGSGYPYGLKCEQIPIEAAIVKIADIYDALRAKRSYKEAFSHEESVKIILNGDDRVKPIYFRKDVLETFKKYHNEINIIWNEINNNGGGKHEFEN